MDRISPSTLRLVVIALGGCAVVGGWMGLSDSLRRSAPAWDQSAPRPAATSGPPEAIAFDPRAVEKAPPTQAPPPVKAETKIAIVPETADPALSEAPAATPAAKTPAGTPKAAPKAAPKADPIADVIQNTTAPPPKAEPPPEVPF